MNIIQIHYNIDNILKCYYDALIYLIFGEKSNGKSYQVKHKLAIEHYIKTKRRFILLRRWKEDVTSLWVEKYFADVDVAKLTEGQYEFISFYRGKLYFAKIENEKEKRFDCIGYVMSLSREQHYSSGSFLDVDIIIFEEFMERGHYLPNEPDKLMIFYSTIDRKRGVVKMFLVGNTISRVNPYLTAWKLLPIIRNLKQGEMTSHSFFNDETEVKIAIEYCKSSGGKKLAIGESSSMIDSGSWQTQIQPKLPKSKKKYKILFRIGFSYLGFNFLAEYLQDSKNMIWFVYPYSKEFNNKTLVFSDTVKDSFLWQRNIYDISFKNLKLQKILDTFRESNIFYSDDLCGTDFKHAIDFSIRK